jgi:RNA polymerase sigma-70 factor (ECF subfamily)
MADDKPLLVSDVHEAGSLFREYAPAVSKVLRKCGVQDDELDDAVQEVFLVAHRRGGYEPGAALPFTWLAEIAVRVAFAYRRKRRARAIEHVDPPAIRRAPSYRTPIQDLEAGELVKLFQTTLNSLAPEKRDVFISCEIDGRSCEAVAKDLGIPVGTVYSRLHAARRVFATAASTRCNNEVCPRSTSTVLCPPPR